MAETIKINKTTMSYNKIWYVDSVNGNDTTGTGAIDKPYATFAKAYGLIAAGDAIKLAAGTYTSSTVSVQKNFTVIGEGNSTTFQVTMYMAGKVVMNCYRMIYSATIDHDFYTNRDYWFTLNFTNCVLKSCVVKGGSYSSYFYMTLNNCFVVANSMGNSNIRLSSNSIKNSATSLEYFNFYTVNPTASYSLVKALFDTANYKITAGSWDKVGDPTILNPDGNRSSIGVYGGPYAWGFWPERRYLVRDNNRLKKHVGSAWEDVGSYPADATEENFMSSTMSLTSLTDATLSQLGSPELLYWTNETATSPKAKLTIVPKPKLLLMNQDIDLSDISNIDSIALTSTINGNSKVGVIVSNDGGTSWTGVNLAAIDTRDLTDVSAKCLSSSALSAITSELWNYLIRDSQKLRFGFYLEKSASTNAASIDELVIQVDYPAPPEQRDVSWRILVNGIEKIPFSTAQNIRLVESSLDTSDLVVGDNTIKIEVESPAGDFGEAAVHVYKEQQFRTSAERTMRSIDGGFIQNNIDFLEMAKPRNKKRLTSSKRELNLAEVQLDKFINTISIN